MIDKKRLNNLQKTANTLRELAVEMVYRAKSGHIGGSLSSADILTALYFDEMKLSPVIPRWEERDRFVLSKGHITPAYYGILALRGFFPIEDLQGFRKFDSNLQGHPDRNKVVGVDMSSGSLGQGFSAAVGMALAGKLKSADYRVYALLGDGEMQEGQVWEAFMFASQHKLDNLCVIIDDNGVQADGRVEDICALKPIEEKIAAFGFAVIKSDGHDFPALLQAFSFARKIKGQPTAIVAKTVKGKGVPFMENKSIWHGKAPSVEEFKQAMQALKGAGR